MHAAPAVRWEHAETGGSAEIIGRHARKSSESPSPSPNCRHIPLTLRLPTVNEHAAPAFFPLQATTGGVEGGGRGVGGITRVGVHATTLEPN